MTTIASESPAPGGAGAPSGAAPQPEQNGARRSAVGIFGARFAVIGVWIAMIALYSALQPDRFFTTGTFQTIFGSQQALVFLTAALLCTIVIGEFVDLSVPSVLGFAAVLMSLLVVDHDWSVWAASLAAVVAAGLIGAVNGFLVVRLGVNTIVVTLGMGTLLLGIGLWLTDLQSISGLPREFGEISLYRVGGLPLGFYWGLLLMLGFAYVLAFTPLGRNMRFVGANREVSRLAGVRVNRIRFGAFLTAGVIAGVGGVLAAAAVGGFDPNTSQSYLLPMFAATFLGTAILQPGRFNPLGTLIAVYFLATGILGLNLLGFTGWVTSVFYGGVLVVAVTISSVLHRRSG